MRQGTLSIAPGVVHAAREVELISNNIDHYRVTP